MLKVIIVVENRQSAGPSGHSEGACAGASGMAQPLQGGKRRYRGRRHSPGHVGRHGVICERRVPIGIRSKKIGIYRPATRISRYTQFLHRRGGTPRPFHIAEDISFLRPKKLILDPRAGLLARGHRVARLLGILQWRSAHRSPTQQRSCRGISPRSLLIRQTPEPVEFPIFNYRIYNTIFRSGCKPRKWIFIRWTRDRRCQMLHFRTKS